MATESTFVWDESFVALNNFSVSTTQQGNAYVTAFGCQYMIVASSAISGSQPGAALALSSTGTGTLAPIGVLQNNPTSGGAANVRLLGRTKMLASSSGTIAYGVYVTSSTWGAGVSCATSGERVLGIARSASTGAVGQLIEVDLTGPWNYVIGG